MLGNALRQMLRCLFGCALGQMLGYILEGTLGWVLECALRQAPTCVLTCALSQVLGHVLGCALGQVMGCVLRRALGCDDQVDAGNQPILCLSPEEAVRGRRGETQVLTHVDGLSITP